LKKKLRFLESRRSRSPVRRSTSRNGEYLVKMRGMPFNVTENDIRKVKKKKERKNEQRY